MTRNKTDELSLPEGSINFCGFLIEDWENHPYNADGSYWRTISLSSSDPSEVVLVVADEVELPK